MSKIGFVKWKNVKTFNFIVALFFASVFSLQSCGSSNGEKPLNDRYTKINAKVFAETQVKKMLKSPSTASFNWNADDFITKINDTTFFVKGYVDSQNSFGAQIRSNYSCTVVYLDKTKMVKCDNLVIE